MRQTQLVASRTRTSELEALNRALTELANTAVTLLRYSLYLLYLLVQIRTSELEAIHRAFIELAYTAVTLL
jgi:hypothetical protein